jgi:hypothetical protein
MKPTKDKSEPTSTSAPSIRVFFFSSPPPICKKNLAIFFSIFTLQNNKGICPNSFVVTMQKFAKNKMTTPTIHWELKNFAKNKMTTPMIHWELKNSPKTK